MPPQMSPSPYDFLPAYTIRILNPHMVDACLQLDRGRPGSVGTALRRAAQRRSKHAPGAAAQG